MRSKGQFGEALAKQYLVKNGFTIVQQNSYTTYGEIDIIAKQNDRIHIIEVKLLKNEWLFAGYKLNRKKRKRMVQCTHILMDRLSLNDVYFQFDLITIVGNQIKHIENIFNLTDVY
jgi:putative endonuclease